ncbi:hypothetical protein IJI31_04510 [bacterium]|nr:hypothetical protein [bacterium]
MHRVIVAGYGKMFTNIIAGVLDAGDVIVGVYRYDYVKLKPFTRFIKDVFNPSKEYSYIKSLNLKEIKARSINSEAFRKQVRKLNADIVIVASWGEKIEKETFIIPQVFMNVHPSLLPKYKGPNPYLWTILNREKESGVTFHLVDETWDGGAILTQSPTPILPDDTGHELRERITLQARGVVCELLKSMNNEIIVPKEQDKSQSSYFSLDNIDNCINFAQNAEDVKARVQALHPWKECFAEFEDDYVVINPYGIMVGKNYSDYTEYGTITEINHKRGLISVLCADNKTVTFKVKSKYKFFNSLRKLLPETYQVGKRFCIEE